jgi:hypothetical protein
LIPSWVQFYQKPNARPPCFPRPSSGRPKQGGRSPYRITPGGQRPVRHAPDSDSAGRGLQEGVDDANASDDLVVSPVLAQEFLRAVLLRRGEDHAVPESELPGLADLGGPNHRSRRDCSPDPEAVVPDDLSRHGASEGPLGFLRHSETPGTGDAGATGFQKRFTPRGPWPGGGSGSC